MKIEIDTSRDSHEDIRKLIRMLKAMVGEHEEDYSSQSIPDPSPLAFNMFEDDSSYHDDSHDDSKSSYDDDSKKDDDKKESRVEVVEY